MANRDNNAGNNQGQQDQDKNKSWGNQQQGDQQSQQGNRPSGTQQTQGRDNKMGAEDEDIEGGEINKDQKKKPTDNRPTPRP